MGHQRPLTTVDQLSVEQAKARLHALDIEFKQYQWMSVTCWMTRVKSIDKEHEIMDEHESSRSYSH